MRVIKKAFSKKENLLQKMEHILDTPLCQNKYLKSVLLKDKSWTLLLKS